MSTRVGSNTSSFSLDKIPDPVSYPNRYERWRILKDLNELIPVVEVAGIVADFASSNAIAFGPQDYEDYLGAKVEEDPLPDGALSWWNSQDTITPFDEQGNPVYHCDTHYGFCYIAKDFTIEKIDNLAKKTKKGPGSYLVRTCAVIDAQWLNLRSVQACWTAMRKGILFSKQTRKQQKTSMAQLNTKNNSSYQILPSLTDLFVIARMHFLKTKILLFENELSRIKQKFTLANKVELSNKKIHILDYVLTSNHSQGKGAFWILGRLSTEVSSGIGVAAIRKFSIKSKPLPHQRKQGSEKLK
jgi:hypothetical protein